MTLADLVIEPASFVDASMILTLLDVSQLPTAGFVEHIADALVARKGGRIVGVVALEVYVGGALLRSLAVAPMERRTGLGRRLTEHAIARARERRVPALYLLTTTAERFFSRFGFRVIDRSEVPASVKQSVEFTGACPDTAVVMRRVL